MILVELRVPALDASYDVFISETVPVNALLEELLELICLREKQRVGDGGSFCLTNMEAGQMLDPSKALADYGIEDGVRLMLV